MTGVFVDTSAVFALANPRDENHSEATDALQVLRARRAALITTSYVLIESYALLGRRLGIDAVRSFRRDFAPLIEVVWVHSTLHEAALDLLIERKRRLLSLVDATSFVTMRQRALTEAFAFDPHFEEEGFTSISRSSS